MKDSTKINTGHVTRKSIIKRQTGIMICCFMLVIALLMFKGTIATAQAIPEAAIDELVKSYKDEGISLEIIYRPDFTKVYPNTGLRYVPCYPGKRLLVLVLMTEKPLQYVFKVKHGDNMVATEHEPESIVLAGKTYWFDYRATAFAPDFSDRSPDCLYVGVMDQKNHKMPIYTFLFTKPR